MNPLRSALLWASQNDSLRRLLPKYRFVQKAVRRFMPGEDLEDALKAGNRKYPFCGRGKVAEYKLMVPVHQHLSQL